MNIPFKSAVKNFIVFSTALFSTFTLAQNKLAIVIDDIGYHPKEDAAIFAMPREISVAIIPSSPYAQARNQEAKKQGRDILIHMPMQPISQTKIEEGGLHLGMSAEQVINRVQKAKISSAMQSV
ncbi:putative polysaccharide deacetylase [Rodentibacter pneumotropicus]|uniref:Putative polysaccharide deacetylase n=1 Tax=Rodentibacter pneumotropicus TaxID=758 RepID=A0A448MU20_9PAST|nr:putative polysaccharide deacetylase [Rodentibacter pneumotropicus]